MSNADFQSKLRIYEKLFKKSDQKINQIEIEQEICEKKKKSILTIPTYIVEMKSDRNRVILCAWSS